MTGIIVTDASRVFGDPDSTTHVRALDSVDLQIGRGAIAVMSGTSGSGKTTLLNLIAGLDRPTSGTVSVFGTEVSRLTDRDAAAWRRDNVAPVFQAKCLVSHLTALENVELVLRMHAGRLGSGQSRRARRRTSGEMLERLGLGAFVDHRPGALSGGQQQRVAIARALVSDAPLLVADEPTGELDSETASEVAGMLTDHVRATGATAVMTTHDPSLKMAADVPLRLEAGRLVRDTAAEQ